MAKEEDLEELQAAVSRLMNRFDAVQVFATRHEPDSDGTVNCQWGSGNWFARYGHIKAWLLKQDQDVCNDDTNAGMP